MLEIVSPSLSRNLASYGAVSADLGVSYPEEMQTIEMLIAQASAAIETWCGRRFAEETYRETIRIERSTECVVVSCFPVTEVRSVSLNGRAISISDLEQGDGGALFLTRSGVRTLWEAGRAVIQYKAGFTLPDTSGCTLPQDITRAATLLVKQAYFARRRDPSIRSEESSGVGATSYGLNGLGNGNDLPPEVQGLLARYRDSVGF
ncbi:hypothetical protein [Gellertiella hungarica]|uniref:Phage gp6-like head-tail connector protein n=1 Tax=Gellertiella hungarica TaxID=1572859 RepID=A0A7W6J4Q4_9HYPH|nr:hypothetical protein [Gellertiella hungarica]MBB4064737.1 hypothetical protein [Gellertiella hungarica]